MKDDGFVSLEGGPDAARATGRSALLAAALAPFCLAFLLYVQTLGHDFVYDGDGYVKSRPLLGSWESVRALFSRRYFGVTGIGNYRPVTTLTHIVDRRLWGLWAGGHHLTSVLIHATACAFVGVFALRITGNAAHAAFAGLFMAAHPVNSEVVNCVHWRHDSLCAIFLLGALVLYMRGRRGATRAWGWAAGSSGLYLLALFSKEAAMTFPALLLLLEFCSGPRAGAARRAVAGLRRTVPYLAVLAAYLTVRFGPMKVPPPQVVLVATDTRAANLLTMPRVLATYLQLLVLPYPLQAEYSFVRSASIFEPAWLASAVFLLGAAAGVAHLAFRNRAAFFGAAWAAIAIAPALTGMPRYKLAAERFLYIPVIGVSLLAATALAPLRRTRPRAVGVGSALLLAAYAALVIHRNRDWSSNFALYTRSVQTAPRSAVMWNNLGSEFLSAKQLDLAEWAFRRALEGDRVMPRVYDNLGRVYEEKEDPDRAEEMYRTAAEISPTYGPAHLGLARLYAARGAHDEALQEAETAVRLMPSDASAWNGLGALQLTLRDVDAAQEALLRARALDPANPDVLGNLGAVYMATRRWSEAVGCYRRLTELRPDSARAAASLAAALLAAGDRVAARQWCETALRLDPAEPLARRTRRNLSSVEPR